MSSLVRATLMNSIVFQTFFRCVFFRKLFRYCMLHATHYLVKVCTRRVNAQFQKISHWIDRLLGGAMIMLGLKLITSKLN